jgi:hypothetical protein
MHVAGRGDKDPIATFYRSPTKPIEARSAQVRDSAVCSLISGGIPALTLSHSLGLTFVFQRRVESKAI